MRTYDPAESILYVHLAPAPGAAAVPAHARDECHRLPAGYPNASPRSRLDPPRTTAARPALVLLPGGSAAAGGPAHAAPALRVAE